MQSTTLCGTRTAGASLATWADLSTTRIIAAGMAHDHAGRMARAAEGTADQRLGGLVVAPGPDLVYLTGYEAPPLERLTALVVRPDADPILIVPELERPRAEASPAGGTVDIESWPDGGDPYPLVGKLLGDPAGPVGASDRMWAVHLMALQRELPGAGFVPASTVLADLRMRKDEDELRLLTRAAGAADEAFRRITREVLEGRREEEIAGTLARHLVEAGHETAAFAIVGSGPNGASPHHHAGERGIRRDDCLVLDFGGSLGGYFSDITRTVVVGAPSDDVREVHEVVHQAQAAAFRTVAPGVPAQEVDRAARQVIEDAGYGPDFIHRTGHGIGLEEHEAPYIVEGNDRPLEVGNTFSIEPGIYLAGRFGVRIEDIVVVTETGGRYLNHAPRELLTVA
jgi:Xaa-Pro aminopeptidase